MAQATRALREAAVRFHVGRGLPAREAGPRAQPPGGPRQLEQRRQRARSLASSGLKAPALGEACVPQQALLRGLSPRARH